jgi:hypothetical protein
MRGEPPRPALHGATRDAERSRRLTLTHAGDDETEERGIEIRLLLPPIGTKGLTRETSAATPASETWHLVWPAMRLIATGSHEESGVGFGERTARRVRAVRWKEHQQVSADRRTASMKEGCRPHNRGSRVAAAAPAASRSRFPPTAYAGERRPIAAVRDGSPNSTVVGHFLQGWLAVTTV